jgi:septation ring formation regulator EzrA
VKRLKTRLLMTKRKRITDDVAAVAEKLLKLKKDASLKIKLRNHQFNKANLKIWLVKTKSLVAEITGTAIESQKIRTLAQKKIVRKLKV